MKADFSHIVIGGGVVGLAIARNLQRSRSTATATLINTGVLLIERNKGIGQETSSRNSEVIHAGLYYPPKSLKTQLCIRGKRLLYEYLEKEGIKFKKCTKWIIAQTSNQADYLNQLHGKAKDLGIATRFLSAAEIKMMEPGVRAKEAVLESSSTGIMDSHGLMSSLHTSFEVSGGDSSFETRVCGITYNKGTGVYTVSTETGMGEHFDVTASSVINAGGLHAISIANMLSFPPTSSSSASPLSTSSTSGNAPMEAYYAKGQYFSYSSPLPHKPKRLLYPCPEPNLAGLGTHLTIDLSGSIKFGPDVTWTHSPNDLSPDLSEEKRDTVWRAVREYLPEIERHGLIADYCGIRPKLEGQGGGFRDFVIRTEEACGFPGFVNLLGIESPGLTSSLAIAEYVEDLVK